ncbi:MAG TPA: hypothetical protein VGT44_11485 [Ktedonobacteraceae bacterium]|nr:hypothetical protein [Ktedonobacteraceae bacterium]
MNKKVMSTLMLFLVFIGFLWWGLAQILHPDPTDTGESIVFGVLLLGCAGYAFVSILMLPRRRQR